MLRNAKLWFKRVVWLICLPVLAFATWLVSYAFSDIPIQHIPLQFSLKQGSSLRNAARQMHETGALDSPWQFEALARLSGDAGRIQAGNYELGKATTPLALLRKITSSDYRQEQIVFVEGWTFRQMRAALDAHAALRHDTRGFSDAELTARLEITHLSLEGLFFPDTYFFAVDSSDISILRRAYRAMQSQIVTLWNIRARGLPLENPYQALILASIVEKESGHASERALIAAVFINRLRLGMRLQTDPTVIYGLGMAFDGNLRKKDLLADGPYNTYTRAGLPPTPIAMPGLDALSATLDPEQSNALYFVARGDGTSQFSNTLAGHERAVTKYQRRGNR